MSLVLRVGVAALSWLRPDAEGLALRRSAATASSMSHMQTLRRMTIDKPKMAPIKSAMKKSG
jgi:hypothetical protein